ncbi:MAG: hypothetical protein IT445_02220 [Phycisphaeraceae bacterium]|nr:hypothetical protein [Phycisphaeraceae bacterium]
MSTYQSYGCGEHRLRSMTSAQLLLLAVFSNTRELRQIDDELDRRACGIHGAGQPDEQRQMRVCPAA